ncbi:MAG TPA: efflux RND transporter periplasmic adaptor subunit [Polyangiaceae bacterium]|nr:efflux RND transporter periplasmic adaptor subunit [Polyangiaceae bacterium]
MRSALLLLLATLPLAAGCRSGAGASALPDPVVSGTLVSFPPNAPQLASLGVEPVRAATTADEEYFGRLTWNDDATVRVFTPFAGRVRRVLVDVGQTVERGTPLAEVESPDFGEAQAEARTAESDLQLAESNLARQRELYDHGAAALKDVEAAEAERARAAAQRARMKATLASCGASADSVTGLFVLRSPIAGTVVERTLTPGQEVRPDQMLANAPQLFSPLFVLSDPSRLWIQIDATEADLARLRPGAPIQLRCRAYPDHRFAGRIDVVSDAVDPSTHTVHARGTVENLQRLLKAEMFVDVELRGRSDAEPSVPSAAVFLKGERHYVFVEKRPGTFARREVTIEDEQDSQVRISAGVHAGERVVTDGCVLLEQLLD